MRQSSAQVDIIIVTLQCDGCEISLRPYTFCNLTEVNAGTIEGTKEERQLKLNHRAEIAAFFGTLQGGFTDFHYLRPIWKNNTEKDALIGVGITGICNGTISDLDLKKSAAIVMSENRRVSKLIGIRTAARCTTIKPSGTTSCVAGTSSGIHAWHSKKYIRNIQCKVGDDLYNFFTTHYPELIKIMDYDPNSAVIGIPQEAPKGALIRQDENALEFLERVKKFNIEWVAETHRRGPNTNNVSATVSINSNEWEDVGNWMWKNKKIYNGLSVLPFDGGTYKNAPFEEVSDEEFQRKLDYIENNPIDLTMIIEEEDNTTQADNLACAGDVCEII